MLCRVSVVTGVDNFSFIFCFENVTQAVLLPESPSCWLFQVFSIPGSTFLWERGLEDFIGKSHAQFRHGSGPADTQLLSRMLLRENPICKDAETHQVWNVPRVLGSCMAGMWAGQGDGLG